MSFLKYTLFGMAVLLTACKPYASRAQSSQTDWDEYELRGRVKELTIKIYKAHVESGTLVKDELWSTTVVEFSPEGKLLQVERKGESKKTYSYTKNQQIIKEYDESRALTGQKVTNYTDWGAIQSIVSYNAKGVLTAKIEYTYDKNHVLTERLYQDVYYQYTKEKNIQFDAAGHEIRCERYNKDNQLKEIETNTYDVDGRKILNKVERYSEQGYDYGGRYRYTYNPEGFTYMVESANDSEEYHVTHLLKYAYDIHGNYITKNNMYDWWPSIQERTIIYY